MQKKIYYYDQDGYFAGSGFSFETVPNSTEIEPLGDALQRFNEETQEWVLHELSLEEMNEVKKQELRYAFYESTWQPLEYKGFLYNSGEKPIFDISIQLSIAKESDADSIKVYNFENIATELSIAEVKELLMLLNKDFQYKFNVKQNTILQLESCSTIEELESIDISLEIFNA